MVREKITLLICVVVAVASPVKANDTISSNLLYKKSYYVHWGMGFGGQKNALNFGIVTQISKKSVVALALHGTRKAQTQTVIYLIDVSPVEQISSSSVSLLYGRIIKRSWGHYTLMGGPSFIDITEYNEFYMGDYYGEDKASFGFLMQGGFVPSYKFFGASANVFLNINSIFTHGGITLGLALGRINYKKARL